jgi:hypothetical protein
MARDDTPSDEEMQRIADADAQKESDEDLETTEEYE